MSDEPIRINEDGSRVFRAESTHYDLDDPAVAAAFLGFPLPDGLIDVPVDPGYEAAYVAKTTEEYEEQKIREEAAKLGGVDSSTRDAGQRD